MTKKWQPVQRPDGTHEPRPGNEYRAEQRRARSARLRGNLSFTPRQGHWDGRSSSFTYARECARRVKQGRG